MLLLLDECVPRTLASHISGHTVTHVADVGWQGLVNGELLAAMQSKGFTVIITVDRSLQFQQPIADFGISVVLMVAVGNTVEYLAPLAPELQRVLQFIKPGHVTRVGV